MENLWPQFEKKKEQTPKAIFEQQVEYFNSLNLGLKASLTIGLNPLDSLIYVMRIQSSALSGYTFTLFNAENKPTSLYPVTLNDVINGVQFKATNPTDLQADLKEIFNSPKTIEVVNNILSMTDEASFF